MHTILAAAGTCTGTWQQQWQCGVHGGGNVGATLASSASTFPPVAIGVLVLLIIVAIARSGSRKTAASK